MLTPAELNARSKAVRAAAAPKSVKQLRDARAPRAIQLELDELEKDRQQGSKGLDDKIKKLQRELEEAEKAGPVENNDAKQGHTVRPPLSPGGIWGIYSPQGSLVASRNTEQKAWERARELDQALKGA